MLAEPNRSEFHHCHPRSRLAAAGISDSRVNVLANVAMISRSENRTISDKLPSEYRALMPPDAEAILEAAQVPTSLFSDDYERFVDDRSALLAARATALIE